MNQQAPTFKHTSVLLEELINSVNLNDGDFIIDCTTGGGGHAEELLKKTLPNGKLLAIDQDSDAIFHLQNKFSTFIKNNNVILEQTPFSELTQFAKKHGFFQKTSAIIADLGVSSHQIDTGERGFSFQLDGPLDMRMNTQKDDLTAKEIVNSFSEDKLLEILYNYGEEPQAYKIVKAIIHSRKKQEITTTQELAEIIKSALSYKYSKKNPATKTFQAIRIYLNQELEELKKLLDASYEILKPSGSLAIITFHSLEDKIVKNHFLTLAGKKFQTNLPREIPLTQEQINSYNQVKGKIIKPFPMTASKEEIALNPRSRSAKLRVIEKI